MPLHVVLDRLCHSAFEIKKVEPAIVESIFGDIMKANTPYSEIIKFNEDHTQDIFNSQQMCDRLNAYLKQPAKRGAILTPDSRVDIKPFALQIG